MADLASTRIFGKLTVMHEVIVKANAEIVGDITASKFIGDGSQLTALPWGEVTGKPVQATRWPSWNEVSSKPSTFTPSAHTHTLSQITDAGSVASLNTTGSTTAFLRGDGTWATPPNTNTTYAEITTAEIDAGTASTLRTISGRRMKYALDKKADTTTQVIAGTGLSGGGTLAANRTLSVNFGTTSGTVKEGNWTPSAADIPNLAASKITSGTFAAARIPTLNQNTTGNAATATRLATSRTINGTAFTGAANITAANWGTARTITIGGTGKSVNGSGNVAWTLAEIGAAEISHGHVAADIPDLDASKIISGTFEHARIPRLTQNVIDPTHKAQVSGNVSLDANMYGVFDFTLTGNAVLEFVMPEVTGTVSMLVRIRQDATARTITWPSEVLWLTSEGNVPAAPDAYMITEYVFSTDGVGWIGREGSKN